jgi:hypothetical protein
VQRLSSCTFETFISRINSYEKKNFFVKSDKIICIELVKNELQ